MHLSLWCNFPVIPEKPKISAPSNPPPSTLLMLWVINPVHRGILLLHIHFDILLPCGNFLYHRKMQNAASFENIINLLIFKNFNFVLAVKWG